MKKQLEGLSFKPAWITHLGCVMGCVEYLGLHVSQAWIYGGTGHAFVINISEDACPSGPTAWKTFILTQLAPNLGYRDTVQSALKTQPDFAEKQEQAFAAIRESIDNGLPCYGWELHMPEFYVINGYDEVGYYCSGPGLGEGDGPKPWQEVGDTGIGLLELYSVQACDPAPDEKVVRDALTCALKASGNPEDWALPPRAMGLNGFETWAKGLEAGTAWRFGHGYNAACWAECREQAVAFLQEAKERLTGEADSLFDEALEHYTVVRDKLKAVRELHPFRHGEEGKVQSPEAAALVREASEAETKGLEVLQRVLEAI